MLRAYHQPVWLLKKQIIYTVSLKGIYLQQDRGFLKNIPVNFIEYNGKILLIFK